MEPETIAFHKKNIDGLSQKAMALLQRFAPIGHPFFITGTGLPEYFNARFDKRGGMTPEISKEIGPK